MPPVLVKCPNPECGKMSRAAEEMLGKTVKCKQCGLPWVLRPTVDASAGDTSKGSGTGSASKFDSASRASRPMAAGGTAFPELPAQFGDRYTLTKLLGEGGMGAVYLADDMNLGRTVALKLPKFGPDDPPQRVERFMREGKAAASFHHPNICTLFDIGRVDGKPYLTMAFIEGRSLSDLIDTDSPMPLDKALDITRKVAGALQHAHSKGIVHRDLKPGNILLDAADEPFVTDFGLAKRLDEGEGARITHSGAVMGTPTYMSPEQVRGEGDTITGATDVYSLGVMLFEMLTGRVPFKGSIGVIMGQILHAPVPFVKDQRPDVPAWVDAAIRRAMSKDADARFPSMAAFAETLATGTQSHKSIALMDEPVEAAPEVEVPRPKKSDAKAKQLPKRPSGDEAADAKRSGEKRKAAGKKKAKSSLLPVYIGGGVGLAVVVGLVVVLALGKGKGKDQGPPTNTGGPQGPTGDTAALLQPVIDTGRWDAAVVRRLTESGDPTVRQAAEADGTLADSRSTKERHDLANRWWAARAQPGLSPQGKAALAARAAFHYLHGLDFEKRDGLVKAYTDRAMTYYAEPDTTRLTAVVPARDLRNPASAPPAGPNMGHEFGNSFLRVPKQENADDPRRTVWKVDSVRLPCIIRASARMTDGGNGDAWVSLFVRDGTERAVRVASSQDYTIDERSFDREDHSTDITGYPHREGRRSPAFNTVTWVILQSGTAGGFVTEVYLNGLYLGTGPYPYKDGKADLRLFVTNHDGDVTAKSEWESVAVWQAGGVPTIADRLKEAIKAGKLPPGEAAP